MRRHVCPLLKRIQTSGKLDYRALTKGLYYSDEEIIHQLLLEYRAKRLIAFNGDEIDECTVFEIVRRNRRGTKLRRARFIN